MTTPYTFEIDGHTMAALSFNEHLAGTPVIFIHGIMSSVNFWVAGQTPIFAERMPWHSLSLPGHYPAAFAPDFLREHLTPELIARLTAGAVRHLVGDRPALLVGHSTGGFAALAVAAYAPDCVQGVISISGFASGRWTGALGLLESLAGMGSVGESLFKANVRLTTASPAIYHASLRAYAADPRALYRNEALPATLERIYPDAARLDLGAMAHYFNRMPQMDITDWLPKIQCPVLALCGDRDPIVPPAASSVIAQDTPQGQLVLIAGAGHLPMAERAGEYTRIITDWVTQQLAAEA